MNIVMFTNTYLPHVGGVARSVDFFARDLRRLGHKVLVVAPHFEGEAEDDQVLRVPALQNFNGSDFSVRIPLPFVIEDRIEAFNPDIIHSHHPFLMGDTALRTARKHGLPLVFTHHTMYDQYTHYVPLDSDALRQFVINLVTLYTDFCDRVVAPSRSIAEILKSRNVQSPVEIIPTGVDTEAFARGDGMAFRRRHNLSPDARVVGHLGRLAPEKNLVYLAQAVSAFVRRHPRSFFLVVGEGPSEKQIEEIFQAADAADRLVMTGRQSGRDLIAAYHAMDLFVFASKTETQGMVLVEAMAAGVPVIALDAPGSREVVEDDINGRLLSAESPPDLFQEAIAAYFQNKRKSARWRTRLADTAHAFSRQVCARRMAQLYKEVSANLPFRSSADDGSLKTLDALVQRVKTEWDLLSQKTQAAAEAIQSGSLFVRQSEASRPSKYDEDDKGG